LVWIGFNWLRIGADGELLWMWWWTFRFLHYRVSWLEPINNINFLLIPMGHSQLSFLHTDGWTYEVQLLYLSSNAN
jgi:hypothetical protein